ncbi:MAG: gas vesicle protein GvpO [Nocardioidaceae bacterium]
MATKKTSSSGSTRTSSSGGTARKSSGTARKSSSASNGTRGQAPRASAPKRMSGMAVAAEAARQLLQLTGREPEGIVGLEKTDDGWKVEVEVVEVRRIPDTTDVLAIYEIEADAEGNLEGYRRVRRYARGVGED